MEERNNYKYGIKSTLAQCWATSGAFLLQLELGMLAITATIVIGALENNSSKDEFLSITREEASWFASLSYLLSPLGNVFSSLLLDRLGHKKCMLLTIIPCIMSQIILHFAKNVEMLYASSILMSLGIGFMNAAVIGYVSEVSDPNLRGILSSSMNIFYYAGTIILTMVYSVTMQWRLTVLLTTVFAVLATLVLLKTPDSPVWLLAKGKHLKARRNLSRLRGKVSYEKCEKEFQEMVKYNKPSNNDELDLKENTNAWRQLLEPEVLRPFRLITIFFFLKDLSSGLPLLPYLVAVFKKFGAPVNVEWTISFAMVICIVGSAMAVFLIPTLGKRRLTLFSVLIGSVCYILIGLIGVYWTNAESITSWIVLILYLIAVLSASAGITPVSWVLVTEIFPAKSRNIACNISSALFFVIIFSMQKCYPYYSNLVEFYNVFTINGIIGLLGCIYIYFCLPETENKTLQEITEFFK